MHRNYLYSVTDKALYDALNTSQITNSDLKDLFLNRRTLVSKETDRKCLALEFSKYHHDYYDHQVIATAMGVIQRKEKTTTSDYTTKIDKDSLEDSLNILKNRIIKESDHCIWHQDADGNYVVNITYETPDYTKSEFKQIVRKDAIITIECTQDGYTLRYPDNGKVKEYEQILRLSIESVALQSGEIFDFKRINLLSVENPVSRTKFFQQLLHQMNGFKLIDVTDAYVYRPKPIENSEEHLDYDENTSDAGVHIRSASLKGEGVLMSDEVQEFYNRGFYISKVRWKFEQKIVGSDIYIIEAMFSNPETFEGFSYVTRGKYKNKGKGAYNKNPSPLEPKEELLISRTIEATARKLVDQIIEEALAEVENESPKTEVTSD